MDLGNLGGAVDAQTAAALMQVQAAQAAQAQLAQVAHAQAALAAAGQTGGADQTQQLLQILMLQQMQASGSTAAVASGSSLPSAAGKGCKGKGEKNQTIMCSVHGKQRGARYLTSDGQGGMKCAPGYECQGGSREEANENFVCSVHNKKRGASNLMDDGNGGMRCAPGFECHIGAKGDGTDKPQKKLKICNFWLAGGCSRGAACTFAHGENEIGTFSDPTAVPDTLAGKGKLPGDWTCPGCGDHQFARNLECRKCGTPNPNIFGVTDDLPPEPKMACSVHGVERGVMDLTNDGVGGICCKPESPCQVGGKFGGKGGGKDKGKDKCKGGYKASGVQKKLKICTYWEAGACTKGSMCSFAHGDEEIGTFVGQSPGQGAGIGGAVAMGLEQMGKAKGGAAGEGGMKGGKGLMPGDWSCPGCGDHQFARNTECRKCGTPNPQLGKGGRYSPYG